jgi:protein gp37
MRADNIQDILKHYPEVSGLHPACLAVPNIDADDRATLEESIAKDGLRHEILLTPDGLLVDGRNRLLACFNGNIEPRFKKVVTDPWQIAYAENIARRHLDTKRKAIFGDAWREHEREAAKERQGTRTDLQLDGNISIKSSRNPEQAARDKIGQRVGVSGKSIDKVAVVKEYAPEKLTDDSSLEEAYREAAKRRKSKAADPVCETPKPQKDSRLMATIVTAKGVESQIPLPTKVVFNKTTDAVDWASYTWNPVTGCEHGCKFCYAREIANSLRMRDYYPNAFEPTFHPYRLLAPENMPTPADNAGRDGRVFVCSMADLFGKWVPDDWIQQVFESCLAAPDWEYLFLTKWPARYSKMPLLPKAWYGSSVIQQSDVARVEKAMKAFDTPCVKWISLEPMLEPITFSDLSWCDLVVIGSQTSTNQPEGYVPEFAPEFDWVIDVVNECREFGVPYYLKANLGMDRPGMKLPKMEPRR